MSKSSRQLPGSACDECRNKKLRCDRQKPQCGTCADAGINCKVDTKRPRRGPKKGVLKALRSRVVSLESRILAQQDDLHFQPDQYHEQNDNDQTDNSSSEEEQSYYTNSNKHHSDTDPPSPKRSRPRSVASSLSKFSTTPNGTGLSELMCTDLDELYFDRVHPIIPILQKYRYFTWAKHTTGNKHRKCLQYAMWTMAMALSTQFDSMREKIYIETRQMLESLDLQENSMRDAHIEHAQAWILITCYEFLRTKYRRGWISAGRVFRLIQLLRLHEVGNPPNCTAQFNAAPSEDWVTAEEARRTFWVAYCLDRFVSIRNGWPLTLNEEMICTCLPSLETDFLSGRPSQVFFLSEAIAPNGNILFSPLAECAILVTICGRALSHKQVSKVEQLYGNTSQDFWIRHEWLDSMLKRRLESFTKYHPSVSVFADPMLLFTFMTLQATIIFLCKIMEQLEQIDQFRSTQVEYRKRALTAAKEIARLSKEQGHSGYFKAHVFIPIAIFLGAERLIVHRQTCISELQSSEKETLEIELQDCLETLRKMQTVNNLAQYHLQLLESGDFTTLNPLFFQ